MVIVSADLHKVARAFDTLNTQIGATIGAFADFRQYLEEEKVMDRGGIPFIMMDQIKEALKRIEVDHGVEIVYACESGSREWGFASKDSDYDVRFIYKRPVDSYLTLTPKRDVIEVMEGELDIVGWDIKKALLLMEKSNPPLYEWLLAKNTYRVTDDSCYLVTLSKDYYSPRAATYHYLNMARNNFKQFIKGKERVNAKKYFYVLHPIFGCMWLETKKESPPSDFMARLKGLVEPFELDDSLVDTITVLHNIKTSGAELDNVTSIGGLDKFLSDQIDYYSENIPDQPRVGKRSVLDAAFINILKSSNED